jgi:hypothetical protein
LTIYKKQLIMSQTYEDSVATLDEVFDGQFQSIRIDEETQKGSVIDVIMIIVDCDKQYASKILSRMENDLWTESPQLLKLRINGKGKPTPVADAKSLIAIVWALPGKKAREFRMQCANYICRILGGDPSLVKEMEIRARNVSDEQKTFFMEGVERPDVEMLEQEERKMIVRRRINIELEKLEAEANKAKEEVHRVREEVKKMRKENFESLLQIIPPDQMDERDRINMADLRRRFVGQETTSNGARLLEDSKEAKEEKLEISIPQVGRKYGMKYAHEVAGNIGKLMKKLYVARHGNEPAKRRVYMFGKPMDENSYWSDDEDLMIAAIAQYAHTRTAKQVEESARMIKSLLGDL